VTGSRYLSATLSDGHHKLFLGLLMAILIRRNRRRRLERQEAYNKQRYAVFLCSIEQGWAKYDSQNNPVIVLIFNFSYIIVMGRRKC
jgi:hypothetical protein